MKSNILVSAICLTSAALMPSLPVNGSTLTFAAAVSGANEVPPVSSPGIGNMTVALDTISQTLRINGSFSNLTSNTTAAHIHCCALLGTNVGVATTVPTFSGFPLGVTSGSFSGFLDLTMPSSFNLAFITAQGSLMAAAAALTNGIVGLSYFNIHTVINGGGEIRGQLSAVPLPAALPLFATGLGILGMLAMRRTRKRAAAKAAS